MAPPLRLAVLGLGRWGSHLLRNFLALPEVSLVAVVDPSPAALARARSQFELPAAVQCLTDWQALWELPGLEAVAIATPATTHYPLVKAALEHHLHVLVEKPMTLEPQSCAQLCALAAQQQRQLVVDHTYLFHPAVAAAQQVLQAQRLGSLRYGYAARTHLGPVRDDVDALWDLAIHDIAILNLWLGAAPSQVIAGGSVWLQPQPRPQFPAGLADMAWAQLTYPNQFQALVQVSWANSDKQRRLAVVGEAGTLVFDELAKDALVLYQGEFERPAPPFVPVGPQPVPLPVEPAEPLAAVCRYFLDCIRQRAVNTRSSGQVATELVKTLAALSQSLQQGSRPVLID